MSVKLVLEGRDWSEVAEQVRAMSAAMVITANSPAADTVPADTPATIEYSPAMEALIRELEQKGGYTQWVKVLRVAVERNGYISREQALDLKGGLDDFRGFTRPLNRIAEALRSEGRVDADLPNPLEAVGYPSAQGFRVPDAWLVTSDNDGSEEA